MSFRPDNEVLPIASSADLSSNTKDSSARFTDSPKDTSHLKKLMAALQRSSCGTAQNQVDQALQSVAESAAFLTRSDFVSIILKHSEAADWCLKAKQGSIDPLLERACNQIMLGILTSVYEIDNIY